MAVGKDAAVGEQASRDSGPLIVSRPLAIDPPRQQLKADDAGVVEGNDDGLRYPLGVPEGFDEIRALEGRVRVIPGFVGVAVADVVQVDAGEVESRAQESFHLRPTVGTIRPARQERSRDPRPSSAPYERAQRRTWVDARPLSVVAHPLPSGEPLLCADERARPVRHRALASRWRRLSRFHVGASPQPKYTDKFTCRINRCTVSVISTPISIQGVGVPQRQAGDIGATYQDAPTKSINVGGTRFVYRRLGADAGVPVIFLHHLGAVLDNWDPRVVDGIAAKHPVVTFDNRGVGASEGQTPDTVTTMADDAIAFVRALGFDQVDLLGFSLGGFVAQVIAQQEPQLVRKIILAGTGPAGGVGIGKVTFGTIRESIKATLTFRDPKELRFFTRTDSGKSAARQFVKRLKERKDNRDKSITVRAFRSQLKAIHAWGTQKPSDLTSIGHPVLIANGDDDTMVPTSNSLDLADRLPDATLRIYPDAGHGGIFQHHAQFVDDALQFLES